VRRAAIAIASGILFGAGLAISGMIDPARVRAFLDLTGQWDPTLAFVMGGAMLPMALAWMIQGRIAQPRSPSLEQHRRAGQPATASIRRLR